MSLDASAGAPKITYEMIKAGLEALSEYDSRFESKSSLVVEIFEAMSSLMPLPSHPATESGNK